MSETNFIKKNTKNNKGQRPQQDLLLQLQLFKMTVTIVRTLIRMTNIRTRFTIDLLLFLKFLLLQFFSSR